MPYTLEIWCDGACRNNGRRNVPVLEGWGVYAPLYPGGSIEKCGPIVGGLDQGNTSTTSNRAELRALIQALKIALDAPRHLKYQNTVINITIRLDSSYTQRCVTEWVFKWENNGWRTNSGDFVKNRDLIEEAVCLVDAIRAGGDTVTIVKIDRSANEQADRLANMGCDRAEDVYHQDDY